MPLLSILVGFALFGSVAWQTVPEPDKGATGVVFADLEVSTMLTANKVVPATFFTNCVRSPLMVVLNSQSTMDWMMTTGAATPTCSDSVQMWTVTPLQRQVWNATPATVKLQFLNAFNSYRAFAATKPSAACVVTGLTPISPTPYTTITASPDPSNPDRFLIKCSQGPGAPPPSGGGSDGVD